MATRLENAMSPMINYLKLRLFPWMAFGAACAQGSETTVPPRPVPVVLVHGFLETGSTFKMLRKRLEKQGFVCLVPRLRHTDARGGLELLSAGLKEDIDAAFGPTQPISIVSFSMGGLVSRYYLQSLDGAKRCKNLITISSPHHGTKAAWLYPTLGAEQMRPGSPFLSSLEQTEGKLGKIPIASYRTPMDLIILPATNSVWDRAENREFGVLMHPLMLTSNAVLSDIEARLLK
jgi:triacylglycerol lipase